MNIELISLILIQTKNIPHKINRNQPHSLKALEQSKRAFPKHQKRHIQTIFFKFSQKSNRENSHSFQPFNQHTINFQKIITKHQLLRSSYKRKSPPYRFGAVAREALAKKGARGWRPRRGAASTGAPVRPQPPSG